jgi:hypothetical protein
MSKTFAALSMVMSLYTLAPSSTPPPKDGTSQVRDGSHDFDFLFGRWKIHNRRLKEVLSGSVSWYEFDAELNVRPIWGGIANMDEYIADDSAHAGRGLTVRLYNPKSGQWSLHWTGPNADSLDKPVVGEFHNGRGEFFDQEEFRGRMIFVRYVWMNTSPTTAHWEQAFSVDGGRSWETNWVMEMNRISGPEAVR